LGAGTLRRHFFFQGYTSSSTPISKRVRWKPVQRRPKRTMAPAIQETHAARKVERPFTPLQFEPAEIVADNVRHRHSDRRGVILLGRPALRFGGFQQSNQLYGKI